MLGFEKDFREWLETDGLGGFASGTVSGIRTRRFQALLLSSQNPPTDRIVLVNGIEAWVELDGERIELSSQNYRPDVVHPRGDQRIESFTCDPWPTRTYRLNNETRIRQELFCPQGRAAVTMRWSLVNSAREQSPSNARLFVRPLLSGRDYHSLHHENDAFNFQTEMFDDRTVWSPYPGIPQIHSWNNGRFQPDPGWYRNFLYIEEQARGLDATEDLASPGWFEWELDGANRQGTVWPWMIGPFVEAWLNVHGATAANQKLAHKQLVLPLLDHLLTGGIGHISEIADADSPHAPGGCPFQAWSLVELLRLIHGPLGCKEPNCDSSSSRTKKCAVKQAARV